MKLTIIENINNAFMRCVTTVMCLYILSSHLVNSFVIYTTAIMGLIWVWNSLFDSRELSKQSNNNGEKK